MSSFLWLLFYLAPLLGLTAALFAWFGWQWRGSDMLERLKARATQDETAPASLPQAEATPSAPAAAAPAPL